MALARADLFQLVSLQYSSCCIGVIDYLNFLAPRNVKVGQNADPFLTSFFFQLLDNGGVHLSSCWKETWWPPKPFKSN